jgi:hypothetical protein
MQLGKMSHQLAKASPTVRQFEFFWAIALLITGCHAISVNVFTRKRFGCRYLSKLNILFGLTAIGFYTGIGNLAISVASHQRFSALMELLYLSFIGLGIYHGIQVWRSRQRDEMPHTRYSGRPLLMVTGIDEGILKRWVEPLGLLGLGWVAAHVIHQNPVALWLYVGAISVFIHETLAEYAEESRLLDGYDAMVEADFKRSVVSGKRTVDQGFSISQATQAMMRRYPEITPEYSDEVQGMLDPEVAK